MKVKDCKFLEKNLIGFVERKLDPEHMAKLTRHAESCRGCRELVEGFASIWQSVDRVEEIEPSGSFSVTVSVKCRHHLL
jgi:hypothetical protein